MTFRARETAAAGRDEKSLFRGLQDNRGT